MGKMNGRWAPSSSYTHFHVSQYLFVGAGAQKAVAVVHACRMLAELG